MFASEPFLIYAVSGKAAVSWCLAKVSHGFFVYCVGKERGLEEGMEWGGNWEKQGKLCKVAGGNYSMCKPLW